LGGRTPLDGVAAVTRNEGETAMAEIKVRSRWVMANGVKTHYSEAGGDGKTIVMLHGGGHGSSGMSGMGGLMADLAGEYVIFAPDSVGGYGLTDPYAPTPRGLLNRVSHTRDFVDALCLDKFTIMGNSQGAWAAAQYAIENPDRVSSLTIGQAIGLDQRPTDAMKALQGYDGTREAMKKMLEGLIVDKSRITDELVDRRQAQATRPGGMESMDRFLKASGAIRKNPLFAAALDMKASLPLLAKSIPTIFIWGKQDPFALPETGQGIEKAVPEIKFHWVDQAGHQVQTDKPKEVAQIIRNFVGK
jgi:pimeloyl-ACP methyl ester carboxylesterase